MKDGADAGEGTPMDVQEAAVIMQDAGERARSCSAPWSGWIRRARARCSVSGPERYGPPPTGGCGPWRSS